MEYGKAFIMKSNQDLFPESNRGEWIRLRTMVFIRWVAIIGQTAAIIIAYKYFELALDLSLCFLAVGLSALANIIAGLFYPESKRLRELENVFMILFDLFQLAFLLFLTGGLNNPFSVLLIAPVVVSAAALKKRSTFIIGSAAILIVTLLSQYYIPLENLSGKTISIANIFLFGNWIAISTGIVFLAFYATRVTSELNTMSDALFATQTALSREQKLTDLGGVIAAAAHELGTPLATIKLTSSELIGELKNFPELLDDALLIRDQANRCGNILNSMGSAGKDDLQMHQALLAEIIREAAEPHSKRGIEIETKISDGHKGGIDEPCIIRRPEIIHGLRNMIQNAVDFAKAKVWVESSWTKDSIIITISDDGHGYPPNLLGRLGDPFLGSKIGRDDSQGYEGMGLGLFIAKTLLERTGAEISFANGLKNQNSNQSQNEPSGAIVEIYWPRKKVESISNLFGENKNFSI
jgi:two-component system sensor histidine kinase RegB